MHWNHRVVRKETPNKFREDEIEISYEIHEVYYNEDGEPRSCTVDGISPYGETIEELKETLERMLNASTQPVLEYSYFENLPKEEIDWDNLEEDSDEENEEFFAALNKPSDIEDGDQETGC